MDREIIFALLVAVAASAAVGAWFFSEQRPVASAADRLAIVYHPDDIRFPLQQAERKAQERKRRAAERRAGQDRQKTDDDRSSESRDASNAGN